LVKQYFNKMDVIKLLDNYKISITDDPNYLKALSVIYLHHKINEEDLIAKVKFNKKERLVLPILFKNGLIEKTNEKDLTLTSNCVSFLEAFNIDDLVISQLIDQISLKKYDKLLLKTSLDLAELDNKSKRDIINLLRSIVLTEEAIKENSKIKYKQTIVDCTFNIILHYITKSINLSPQFLFSQLTNSLLESESVKKDKPKFLIYKKKNKGRLLNYFKTCNHVFARSNSYHIDKEFILDFDTNFLKHEAVFLTTIRHTSICIHSSLDDDLSSVINTGYKIHSPFSLIEKNDKVARFNIILDSIYNKGLIKEVVNHIPILSLVVSFFHIINSSYKVTKLNSDIIEAYSKMVQDKNIEFKDKGDSAHNNR